MRRSLFAMAVAGVLATSGLTACGGDDEPTPAADADLVVEAVSALAWDRDRYSAEAGDITIELVNNDSLAHTLLIDGVDGFKLDTPTKGDRDDGSVELEAGTYEMYCDVPGHREGGMVAVLTVR